MRWVLLVAISVACVARAHDADVIYVLAEQGSAPDVLVETVTLTGASLALLVPIDADGDGALSQADLDARARGLQAGVWDDMPLTVAGVRCEFLESKAVLREGYVELAARHRCPPGELRQDFRFLRVLPTNYRVALGSQLEGERAAQGFAQGSLTTLTVPRPRAPGAWDPRRFRGAFDDGLQRPWAVEWLGCLAAVIFSMTRWRRALVASALLLAGVIAGSFVALEWTPPTLLALAVAISAALTREPPVVLGLVLGAAIGARGGDSTWPSGLGLAAGSALVVLPISLVLSALGVMLGRRPGLARFVRWGPVAVALGGAALCVARVST